MKNYKVIIIMVLTITAGVWMADFASRAADETKDAGADSAKPAPAWSLTDINGKIINSSDLKGKVVILDFWATWCGPCQVEIPGFIALQKQYGDQGLVVVGASVDEGGVPVVKKFAVKIGINYSVGLAGDAMQSAFGGIDALPTTLLIDRQGRLVKRNVGLTDKTDFEAEIKALLR